MRHSAHAEAAALRWRDAAGSPDEAGRPRRRAGAACPTGPPRSAIADGAVIRLLDREPDAGEPAHRRTS
jgi:hypothetical protein